MTTVMRAVLVTGLLIWGLFEEKFLDVLEEHDET
jgi:hypothetical protein